MRSSRARSDGVPEADRDGSPGIRSAVRSHLLACVCALAVVGCGGDDTVSHEVSRAIERTVPGQQKPSSSGVLRTGWSATASWEFELTMSWPEYQEWVSDQLRSFDRPRSTDDVLVFVRVLDGDTHTIHLTSCNRDHPCGFAAHLRRKHRNELRHHGRMAGRVHGAALVRSW